MQVNPNFRSVGVCLGSFGGRHRVPLPERGTVRGGEGGEEKQPGVYDKKRQRDTTRAYHNKVIMTSSNDYLVKMTSQNEKQSWGVRALGEFTKTVLF